MSEHPIFLAQALVDRSQVRWESPDRLALTPTASRIPFEDLSALESIEVFVESIDSERDPNPQSEFNRGANGFIERGETVVLRVPRQVRKTVVAPNLNDLLATGAGATELPPAYLLTHGPSGQSRPFAFARDHAAGELPPEIRAYHDAVALWELLRNQAGHVEAHGPLLFFGIRRIEIAPGFKAEDLERGVATSEIRDFLRNEDRRETRREIFASALSEFLRDQNAEQSFPYLLRESNRFARRLREGLALFLSEHSPEKLAEDGLKNHFELAERVEKTVTAIELKSLTIPISLILVANHVEAGAGWTPSNLIILTSVVLYLLVMTIAHSSHLTTLRLVKERIDKTVQDLTNQGLAEDNPVIAKSFASLATRRRNCCVGAWIAWLFSLAPVIAVFLEATIS